MTTAKSVILDIADNQGTGYASISIRSIEFFLDDVLINILGDHNYYATTKATNYDPDYAFDISKLKTGASVHNAWGSVYPVITNQRLIVVFNSSVEFDKIVVNNGHNYDGGANTNIGAKNVKITISSDAITDTTYNATIANSEVIFDGIFDEHVVEDVEDPQIVYTAPIEGIGDIQAPTPAISGVGENEIRCIGNLVAKSIKIEAEGVVTTVGQGNIVVPRVVINAHYGSVGRLSVSPISITAYGINTTLTNGSIVVPAPVISLIGIVQIVGTGNIEASLPTLNSIGVCTIIGTGQFAPKLPSINSSGYVSPIGLGNIVAKRPILQSEGSVLKSAFGNINQPVSRVYGYGYVRSEGIGALVVKVPRISGHDTPSEDYTIIKHQREGACS